MAKLKSKHKVVSNSCGKVVPVRVRITPKDWAEARAAKERNEWASCGLEPLGAFDRALARVLNSRYVGEVGLKPGTVGTADRTFVVTLRRYVGRKLDPTPAFVVELTEDYTSSALGLHEAAVRQHTTGGQPENDHGWNIRAALPLPAKARRAPRVLKPKNGVLIDSPMKSPRTLEAAGDVEVTESDVIRL